MRFILASSSPRRRDIISDLLIDSFEIIKPDIDETQHAGESPIDYVKRLSQEKAAAVAQQIDDDSPILAADTVVILATDINSIETNGEILGKPTNADDARTMLQRLRNRPHTVCTAFTLKRGRYQVTEYEQTRVYMRDYSDAEIDAYIATGDPFDKAGSYAIQHEGFHPVDRIDGSYQNVVGLPAEVVRSELIRAGVPVQGVPFNVLFRENQFLEFIPTDTPLIPTLYKMTPITFSICVVKRGDQYLLHYNPQRQNWEHAGGGIEDGEHPDDTAVRELFEETGQVANNVRCVGVLKIHFNWNNSVEYAPVYIGEIDALVPFTPNNESTKLIFWDESMSLDAPIGQISYGLLKFL